MRRRRVAALVLCLLPLAAGCSGGQSATTPSPGTSGQASSAASPAATVSTVSTPAAPPSPSTAGSTSPEPAPSPAATTAGDLDATVFPAAIGRWKAVKGQGDEGTYQPNGSWVHALDPEQVVDGLAMQACGDQAALPRPSHVLASDYQDDHERRAVGQALRFSSAAQASSFVTRYSALVKGCVGSTNPMSATVLSTSPALVDRRAMLADSTRWVEAVRAHGTLVRMVVANEQDRPLTAAELARFTAAA